MKDFTTISGRNLAIAAALVIAADLATIVPWQMVAHKTVEAQIAQLHAENAALRAQLARTRQEYSSLIQNKSDPHSRAVQAELDELLKKDTDRHPAVIARREKLAALKASRSGATEGRLTPDAPKPSEKAQARQVELLKEEIQLTETQIGAVQRQIEAGRASMESLVNPQRARFRLKRELAAVQSDLAGWKQSIEEEIKLLEQQLQWVKKRIEVGAAPLLDEVPVKLELLKLERELAAFE